jgi:hypothetical protein
VGDAALRQELSASVYTGQGGLLVSGSVIYVDTIADLQALDTSALVDGQQVQVKEYHAGTGVGGGLFYWSEFASKNDHNGGSVIDPSIQFPSDFSVRSSVGAWYSTGGVGSGCFVRADDDITATKFGANPDALHPVDQSLQALSNYIEQNGGGVLHIDGIFFIGANGLLIGTGVSIQGISQVSSGVLYDGTEEAITIESTSGLGTPEDSPRPHVGHKHGNFSVTQIGSPKTGTGIWNRHNTRSSISHVTVKGFDRGIDCSGACWINSIRDCWIVLNKHGIYVGATDGNFVEPGGTGYTSLQYSGLNASQIEGNELQANDYGVYCAPYPEIGSAAVADKLSISRNSIEGGGQAVQFTPHQYSLTISENYTEVNGQGMTIDPETDPITDINLVAADYVQNKFSGSAIQRGLVIRENHLVAAGNSAMIYLDRASATSITGNQSFLRVLVMKQRVVDYSVGPYIVESNVGQFYQDGVSRSNTYSVSNSGMDNFLGASRNFTYNSTLALSKGVSLSPQGALPTGTTSPSSDLASIPNETFYWDFVSGSGYPEETGSTSGSIYGFKLTSNDYQYCWQVFTSSYGAVYRRRATSSTAWGQFVQVFP